MLGACSLQLQLSLQQSCLACIAESASLRFIAVFMTAYLVMRLLCNEPVTGSSNHMEVKHLLPKCIMASESAALLLLLQQAMIELCVVCAHAL
jgi:hypothetical protein